MDKNMLIKIKEVEKTLVELGGTLSGLLAFPDVSGETSEFTDIEIKVISALGLDEKLKRDWKKAFDAIYLIREIINYFENISLPYPQHTSNIAVKHSNREVPSDMKIGEIARTILRNVLTSGKVSEMEIANLQDKDYSKQFFGIQYPVLRKRQPNEPKRMRYYGTPLDIRGTQYWLCSEWFETELNNDRPLLIAWLSRH